MTRTKDMIETRNAVTESVPDSLFGHDIKFPVLCETMMCSRGRLRASSSAVRSSSLRERANLNTHSMSETACAASFENWLRKTTRLSTIVRGGGRTFPLEAI